MNIEEKATDISRDDYGIGFDGRQGEVMIVTIPLRKWSEDARYGDILVSGLFKKAERIALKNIQLMREEKKQSGLIVPVTKPELSLA